jgi:exopolyphosphatase/guanosine-5'-triphosphate,3'-diphosphate pyrophosphatase
MAVYCPDKITNFKLKRTELAALADKLKGLSGVEREKLPGIESGRGETIVFGIELVCCLLDSLKCSVMTVSDAGLMQGVFHSEYSRHAVLSPAD